MSGKRDSMITRLPLKGAPDSQAAAYPGYSHRLIISQNNPKGPGGNYLSGGPFFVYKITHGVDPSGTFFGESLWPFKQTYSGMMVPAQTPIAPYSFGGDPSWTAEQGSLNAKAPSLYKRARPGNPQAGVFTTLGELGREGIPRIPLLLLARLRNIRSVGSEYLNYNFGWAPLVRDIQKMYETYRNLDKQLDQLRRDNGRLVRRRRTLGKSTDTTSTSTQFSQPFGNVYNVPWFSGVVSGSSTQTVQTITEDEYWFSGAFKYWIPDAGTPQWTRRATAALFGVNPTPEAIWNLLPWSWLADWFSNAGDVLSNASPNAADNVTAAYGFVMHSRKVVTTYTTVGFWNGRTGGLSQYNIPQNYYACSYVQTLETKSRVAANPYALSAGWDGLSPYQASILAALGVSRR